MPDQGPITVNVLTRERLHSLQFDETRRVACAMKLLKLPVTAWVGRSRLFSAQEAPKRSNVLAGRAPSSSSQPTQSSDEPTRPDVRAVGHGTADQRTRPGEVRVGSAGAQDERRCALQKRTMARLLLSV
jgi:hypothetical protein